MGAEILREWIEFAALGIESVAVILIVGGIVLSMARYTYQQARQPENAYKTFKEMIGKSLMLGLEFLIAADIIRTVALKQTMQNVVVLAVLVLIRTFLSWSLVVEMEDRWPWQQVKPKKLQTGESFPADSENP